MNRFILFLPTLAVLIMSFAVQAEVMLPGLDAPATVVRDSKGIPHILADNEHDLYFMQGRIHAQDRLFQMDLLRRSAAGTLAELLGPEAIQTDVETRTIGLGRAAERSLAAHPQDMLDILQAYSDGVNSYADQAIATGRLPPEYGGLGLKDVKSWEPLDSVLVGKALGAATSLLVPDDIELTVALETYKAVGAASGLFDGNLLFFEDLFRSAPFDSASTIPDALGGFNAAGSLSGNSATTGKVVANASEQALKHSRGYLNRIRKLPQIPGAIPFGSGNMGGSNSWVIGGQHTSDGHPMLANDMHLRLESPTIFHEIHLAAPGIDVSGAGLPGAPCVVRGHNESIAWGITNSRLDVTDIYAEVIVPDSGPSGLATLHNGKAEPIEIVIEAYNANINGVVVPVFERPVLIVPRRNNGPLITEPKEPGPFPGSFIALSVQSVGFSPTRDPEGICAINRADNLDEFEEALQLIDFASQNFTYADTQGNIGYFVSGEVPLREDLQNPGASITPPFLIRSGYTGNEWIPISGDLPANQALAYEILPFNEMPQVINPDSGVIVNANNDQAGNTLDNNPLNDLRSSGGLRYLNWGGRNFSIRAGRETEMINERLTRGRGKISFGQMKAMQADIVLNDAKALMPFILEAYENALQSAHPMLAAIVSDSRVGEAVGRLRHWNFKTPTGIAEGYDADSDEAESDASVAATIYSVWRGKMIANTIDATLDGFGLTDVPRPAKREEVVTALKHLLERDGVGVSGLNFFNVPDDNPGTRRDIVILASLAGTLDMLASDDFAPAFARSTNQDDYRWGRLHRIVFKHVLGGVEANFNLPPAFGFFAAPLAGLAGIPVDGGFETVDEAPPLDVNNIRVSDSDSFMFDFGPTGRFVASLKPDKVKGETSLPGGESAVPGNPFYINLLEPWLRNETLQMYVSPDDLQQNAISIMEFVPSEP
jgi:penicillin amidase